MYNTVMSLSVLDHINEGYLLTFYLHTFRAYHFPTILFFLYICLQVTVSNITVNSSVTQECFAAI